MKTQVSQQLTLKEARKVAQADMSSAGIIMTCANCEYGDTDKNLCTKYGQTPPISVVSTGCSEWELELPF